MATAHTVALYALGGVGLSVFGWFLLLLTGLAVDAFREPKYRWVGVGILLLNVALVALVVLAITSVAWEIL